MGKIPAFKRRSEDYDDIEEPLREFYAEEREERDCRWLEQAVRRAKAIPRMAGNLKPQKTRLWRPRTLYLF